MNFASSVLNVKALVGASNQEKALVGAFSVIMKTSPMVRLQLYVVCTLRSSSQTQLSQLRGNTSGCPTLQHQITPWPDPGPGLPVNIISGPCEDLDVETCAVKRATLPLVVRLMI